MHEGEERAMISRGDERGTVSERRKEKQSMLLSISTRGGCICKKVMRGFGIVQLDGVR